MAPPQPPRGRPFVPPGPTWHRAAHLAPAQYRLSPESARPSSCRPIQTNGCGYRLPPSPDRQHASDDSHWLPLPPPVPVKAPIGPVKTDSPDRHPRQTRHAPPQPTRKAPNTDLSTTPPHSLPPCSPPMLEIPPPSASPALPHPARHTPQYPSAQPPPNPLPTTNPDAAHSSKMT